MSSECLRFPILKPKKIVEWFEETEPNIGIQVSFFNPLDKGLNVKKCPTAELDFNLWFGVYHSMLKKFPLIGIDVDKVIQSNIGVLDESFGVGMFRVTLGKVLHNFFAKIGITDFELNDLLSPQYKRTQKFISALINYHRFVSSSCKPEYERIMSEHGENYEIFNHLNSEVAERQSATQAFQKERSEEEPEITKLTNEVNGLENEVTTLNCLSDENRAELDQINNEIILLTSQINDTKLDLQKEEERYRDLEDQIVRSPEAMQEELIASKEKIVSLQQTEEELYERRQELEEHIGATDELNSLLLTNKENLIKIQEVNDKLYEKVTEAREIEQKCWKENEVLAKTSSLAQRSQCKVKELQIQYGTESLKYAAYTKELQDKQKMFEAGAASLQKEILQFREKRMNPVTLKGLEEDFKKQEQKTFEYIKICDNKMANLQSMINEYKQWFRHEMDELNGIPSEESIDNMTFGDN